MEPVHAPLRLVQGDLLSAQEEYIVQQCCCTAMRPHGLSASIQSAIGVNPYTSRTQLKGNWATVATRPQPGTVSVLQGLDGRKVVCLFGQYTHGKPGVYRAADPAAAQAPVPDTAADRLRYFKAGLQELEALKPRSVALPEKIGCGLAGGNWTLYKQELEGWAARNPGVAVVMYRL